MKNSLVLFTALLLLASGSVFGQTNYGVVPTVQTGSSNAQHLPVGVPDQFTTGTINLKGENEIVLAKDFYVSSTTNFHAYLVPPPSYAELKDRLDASYFVTIDGQLYFKYDEKYKESACPNGDGALVFKIYNYQRQLILSGNGTCSATSGNRVIDKKAGLNFLKIDLDPSLSIANLVATNETDSYYTLEVLSEKAEKKLLRFKYIIVK